MSPANNGALASSEDSESAAISETRRKRAFKSDPPLFAISRKSIILSCRWLARETDAVDQKVWSHLWLLLTQHCAPAQSSTGAARAFAHMPDRLHCDLLRFCASMNR